MDAPQYPFKPIYGLRALALALGESEQLLIRLATRSDQMYRHVPHIKKNGEQRDTYDAYEPLKRVQRKIVDRILSKVIFPRYLHGGIRDKDFPRSIYSNAAVHAGAKVVLLQDIKNFYPSITIAQVQNVFRGLFGFGEEVVEQLSLISTREKSVPQGASTSGYLANLVFWDVEAQIVDVLNQAGYCYSRFADDITISSHQKKPAATEVSQIISTVTNMLASKGCYQKRSKLHVRVRGQSLVKADGLFTPLTITGLSVFNVVPGIDKAERKRIRSAVRAIEVLVSSGSGWLAVEPAYRSAMGRVGRLLACGHPDGTKFKARLNSAKCASQTALLDRYKIVAEEKLSVDESI